jgi:tetrahydromethanopterin S-methyltransferase subunit G
MRNLGRLLVCATVASMIAVAGVSSSQAGPPELRIQSRIKSLQRQIDSGVRAGKITPEENAHFQARLDKIRDEVEKSGGETYVLKSREVQSINNRLDSLEKDLDGKNGNVRLRNQGRRPVS